MSDMIKDSKTKVEGCEDVGLGEVESIDDSSYGLAKRLDTRHLVMISIGNSIGQGLWLGTGPALVNAGPASLFIGFFVSTSLTFSVCQAVGELSVMYPLPAPFAQWSIKFLDRASAVAVGFSYWLACSISYANQLQAINTVLQYWTSAVPTAAWISIFNVFFLVFGFLGVKYFGEIEVFFTTIKVLWIAVVIVASSIASSRENIGFHYWRTDPCINGFKGFLSTLSSAIFAMAGSEMMGASAPECKNPKTAFPKATKTMWVRMGLFYLCGSLMAGIVVSPFDSALSTGTLASPYSIGFKNAGIPGLSQAMNVIIFVSVISSGISDPFAASRQLHGLADLGIFPRVFSKVDRRGVPWVGVLSSIVLGGGNQLFKCFEIRKNCVLMVFKPSISHICLCMGYYFPLSHSSKVYLEKSRKGELRNAMEIIFHSIFFILWCHIVQSSCDCGILSFGMAFKGIEFCGKLFRKLHLYRFNSRCLHRCETLVP